MAAHQAPVPGILQARTLEWVAISFSNALEWKVKVKSLSRVRLFATPWTTAYQASPSMGFSRQEYWSGVPLHDRGLFSPDSGDRHSYQHVCALLVVLGENLFCVFFQHLVLLEIPGIPWPADTSFQYLPLFSHVYLCLSLPFFFNRDTSQIRAHTNSVWTSSWLDCICKTPFPNNLTFADTEA